MSNTATTKSDKVTFLSIEEFKTKMNLIGEKAQVIRNPNADAQGVKKLFLSIGSSNFKCQQSIDGSKEMKMLVDDGDYAGACLTNIKGDGDNVVFAL